MGDFSPGARETSSLARRRVAFLLVYWVDEEAVDSGAGGTFPEFLPGGLAELVKHGYRMRRHLVQGLEVSSSLARTHLNF